MKSLLFNGLLMAAAVGSSYLSIRALPDVRALPPATLKLVYEPIALHSAEGPLRLAGAWQMKASDARFGGLSALAIDGGHFLAVGDRGSVARFSGPSVKNPSVWLGDLRDGPGPWGEKWARDAESLAPDPKGRGWWVGFEQVHSLFLYDTQFRRAVASISLRRPDWRDNRGAEGLVVEGDHLLVTAENGRQALRVGKDGIGEMPLAAGAEVAEAARAPDGSTWLLLRSKSASGIQQSIARLIASKAGYRVGPAWPVPKGAFDNYEGMAIERRVGGGWRIWLVTDDGHRFMARTLLVALDYRPAGHDKSPAQRTGLSK